MSRIIYSNLGDIGKVCMCKRVLKEQTSDSEEIPFYKISTFGSIADTFISRELYEDYKNKYSYPKKGDVLISAAGTLGRTVIYDGEVAFFQDSNIVWIDNDETKVLNLYLYYFYKIVKWKKTTGSTIDRLYNDNISGAEIFYPENLEEQRNIIRVLKTIDDKIANNNMINAELETMARSIYNYWFLQFDFPNEEGNPYKSSGGKMVWDEELKKEIPDGWKVEKIESLCSLRNGINYDKNDMGDKNYKIVNVRNITASTLILDEFECDSITLNSLQADKYIIDKDDILIARSGTPGAVRILLECSKQTIFCGFIICCTPRKKNQRLYLTYCLKTLEGSGVTKTGGSIMQNVSQDTLKNINVCVPSSDVIEVYNNKIETILNKIQNNIQENQQLVSLRDFLLPLLMNGQVGFKEE